MSTPDDTATFLEEASEGVAPGGTIGRFIIEGSLGAGGMGVVLAARDPALDRRVAIKLVRHISSSSSRERLLREAQAMARVQHPNVATVYEVGEVGAQLFIAMELVAGQTLQGWLAAEARSPQQIVRMFVAAGTGLAAVHEAGLVHRDFKPTNVLVGGDDRPRVSDFGVVSSSNAPAAGASSSRTGTVAYMAPEQWRGAPTDARSDQFSFCLALYTALYRARPFAEEADADARRAPDRPPPKTNAVPGYLFAVVTRGLAADPAARWPSMPELLHALTDDPSLRRRRFTVAALALVAIALLLLVGRWELRRSGRARMRSASALGQTVQTIRTVMRTGHLLPAHDIRQERDRVRALLGEVKAQMSALGEDGRGAGEFALGAGLLALGDIEPARAHLEAAWAAGERSPDLAYDLGLVLGTSYRQAMMDLPPSTPAARKQRTEELRRTLRDPALARLHAAVGAADTSPAYVEALIAYYDRRPADAQVGAERAFAETPTLYEAGELAGRTYTQLGSAAANNGKATEARAHYARALALFQRVQEIARSDEAVFREASDSIVEMASQLARLGDDPHPLLQKVIDDCDRAHLVDSEATWPDEMRAFALWQLALADTHVGQDSRSHLEAAIASAERAIAKKPSSSPAQIALGEAWLSLGIDCLMAHGQDPSAALDHAIAAFSAALKVRPDGLAYRDRGYAQATQARWRMLHGQDARSNVEAAVAAADDAATIDPDDPSIPVDACSILSDYATFRLEHGQDPEPLLKRAEARCAVGHAMGAGVAPEPHHRADIEITRARASWRRGDDPAPAWSRADKALAETLVINPQRASAHGTIAVLASLRADHARRTHRPAPVEELARALREADAAAKLDPSDAQSFVARATAQRAVAAWRPAFSVATGLESVARAVSIDPTSKTALLVGAELELLAARRSSTAPTAKALASAADFTRRALAIDPTSARALWLSAQIAELQHDSARAQTERQAALAIDPKIARESD